MNLSFEWFVAKRYVFSKKRQRFTSIIANISVAGISIGVASLIVVISIMTGFQETLKEKILSITPHVMVEKTLEAFRDPERVVEQLRNYYRSEGFEVERLYPYVSFQGVLLSSAAEAGVVLKGVPVEELSKSGALKLVKGNYPENTGSAPYSVILGRRLAELLGVSVGDHLRFLFPKGMITPFGIIPKFVSMKVSGIFETGLYDYDVSFAFMPLEDARRINGGAVTGIEVMLRDPFASREVASLTSLLLGYSFYVTDWQTLNRSLFSALKLEKTGMFVALTLIVVVAAFNIIAALVMLVSEKRPDIAILKAMGATDGTILRIFVLAGLLLGVTGTALGLVLGLLLCAVLSRYPVIKLPSDVYPVDYLPVRVEVLDVLVILSCAVTLTLIAAVFPARQAAKLPPAEVLRYG